MNHTHSHLSATAATFLLSVIAAATAYADNPISATVTPYTFIGRVMDAKHAAFDTNRVCTISAYDSESRELIAETESTYLAGVRENYALKIPVATASANDHAVQDDDLAIEVTDEKGKVWQGKVPDSVCGAAGGIRRVDIVLGNDSNGDGIDDTLYNSLQAQWEDSDYWQYGKAFDPNADYDGDGISTINEAYAGTDPFNPKAALRITSFKTDAEREPTRGTRGAATSTAHSLSFEAQAGRAYSIETTTNLVNPAWAQTSFTLPDSDKAEEIISIPSTETGYAVPVTIYLLPTDDPARFYRVHLE